MTGRLGFNLLLAACAAYFAWSATNYEREARTIPLAIGVAVFLLQTWLTIKEWKAAPVVVASEHGEAPPPADEAGRVLALSGWMVMFFALFTLIGSLPAIFLFILLFLGLRNDVKKPVALAVAGGMSFAIWLLFVRIMRFELYPGVLFGGTLPSL